MSKKVVEIAGRKIGGDAPCFLIAEVGTTCMGSVDRAKELIKAAKVSGMDAIKFQVIDPEQLSDKSVTYNVERNGKLEPVNMYEMMKKLKFSEDEWREIVNECERQGILFFATVDYIEGVDLMERLNVAVHKIGAWDATYRQLIERIGYTKKPVFVDLGPTSKEEISELIEWFQASGGCTILFLHDFHTLEDRQMNLRAVQYLNEHYPWPAGFSAPAKDHDLDFAALALGAAYIEKRLILDRKEVVFHAHESLEPSELKEWVSRIRHIERALGKEDIIPTEKDLAGAQLYYRSACSLVDINEGEIFNEKNLGAKRPGNGIPTKLLPDIWGKKAKRSIPSNTLITEKDF